MRLLLRIAIIALAAVPLFAAAFDYSGAGATYAPIPTARFAQQMAGGANRAVWLITPAGRLQRYELNHRNQLTRTGDWPLRGDASAFSVAPVDRSNAWIVDRAMQQAFRIANGTAAERIPIGEHIDAATALPDGSLVVNTPQNAAFAFARFGSDGKVIARFGARLRPLTAALDAYDNRWILAAANDGGIVAAHAYRPLLRRYDPSGTLLWEREIETDEVARLERKRRDAEAAVKVNPATCCTAATLFRFATELLVSENEIVVRYAMNAALEIFTPAGAWVRRVPVGGRADRPWWTSGIAMAGDHLVAAERERLAVYAPARGVRLSGAIHDDSGKPVGAARIAVAFDDGGRVQAESGVDGRFSLAQPRADAAGDLTVAAEGFLELRRQGRLRELLAKPLILERMPLACIIATDANSGAKIITFRVRFAEASTSLQRARRAEQPAVASDADGRACAAVAFRRPFSVRVEAEGYATREMQVGEDDVLDVALQPEAALALLVRDAEGRGVIDATVEIDLQPDRPLALSRAVPDELIARTGEEGRATFHALAAGTVRVVVSHPDFLQRQERVELREGANELDVTLERGATLRVNVTAAAGSRIAGVEVEAGSTGQQLTRPLRCTTSSNGTCTITGAPAGRYTMNATASGWTRATQSAVVPESASSVDVDIRMTPALALSGRVTGIEAYAPIALEAIVGKPGAPAARAPVGSDGTFAITDAPSGRVNVWIDERDTGSTLLYRSVDIPATASYDLQLELPRPLVVRGAIVLDAAGCGSCEVSFERRGGEVGRPTVKAKAGADGRYAVRLPSRGIYVASARDTITGTTAVQTMTVDGDRTADFDLSGGSLVVRTIDENGSAVAGAMVELTRDGMRAASLATDTIGIARFRRLARGEYRVTASESTGVAATKEVEVLRDEVTTELTLHRRALRVRLVDAVSTLPIARASFHVRDAAGRVQMFENLQPDGDGNYVLPVAFDGALQLVIRARAYAMQLVERAMPNTPLQVALTPGARSFSIEVAESRTPCSFALLDARGVPMPLSFEAGAAAVPLFVRSAVFYDQQAGRYTGVLIDCDGTETRQPIELARGVTTHVRF